jgi:UDP-glucose 4-epimerase
MEKKKLLITGAHGFIGRYAARFFSQQGWEVTGVGYGEWEAGELAQWGVSHWYQGAITLERLGDCGRGTDAIIHCAGSGSVSFSLEHPAHDFQDTVGTTLAVLEFMRLQAPHSHLLLPSSAAVYGASQVFPLKESTLLSPISPYGVHKKIAEELCASYASFFGLAVSVIRLFSVYGAGLRKQLLWDACQKIARQDFSFFGSGQEARDLIHVEDVARLFWFCLKKTKNGFTLMNGASGQSVTVKQILTELFLAFKRSERPIFSGRVREGDPNKYEADISRAVALGWKPHIALAEGIRNYVTWWRDHQEGKHGNQRIN